MKESQKVTCWKSVDAIRVGLIMQWRPASRPEHQPLEEWTLSSLSDAASTGSGGRGVRRHRVDTRLIRGSVESLVEAEAPRID